MFILVSDGILSFPTLRCVWESQRSIEIAFIVLHYLLLKLKEERGVSSLTELTKDLHVYPDLHGNRSPLADPKMRGSIVGLELDMSLSSLVLRFNATLESIALQTRHIVDTMNEHGHAVNALYVSGSQAKNEGLMALVADVCEMEVVIPERPGAAVVLGAAMLGRMAREVQEGGLDGEGKMSEEEQAERLWKIMVSRSSRSSTHVTIRHST
jgi:ribulose kinase